MSDPKNKKIKWEQKKHQPAEEMVIRVLDDELYVAPGETIELLIEGKEGFTVYVPYPGVFNAQVFEAEEGPAWAEEEQKAESGGSGGTSGDPIWGVRMTRIAKKGKSPISPMPYCIYSKDLENFAVGNSPPKMKLDP